MPVVKLAPDVQLDPPTAASGVTKLPADTQLDSAPKPAAGGAFYGATGLLPQSVQDRLPSFVSGPSVGEQLTKTQGNIEAQEKKLGRPLTLKERLAEEPVMQSPVAAGFATHQIGELPGAMAKATQIAGEKFIKDQYTRAVKPTVTGKTTASDLDRYQAQTRDAISSIVSNKPNLKFTDDAGNVRQGELPKSLEEFGDAIEQTKQGIFQQYDVLAKQTQAAGMDVSLMPVVGELGKIANDPVTGLMHPELVKYAQDRATAFLQAGQLSAVDAQRAVASLNQTLKAFYRNPSYETAARANVDAMIANQLRSALDQAVENAVGPGYQELKNQYGALKAIEQHVNRRAQVVDRQEKGGGILGRIADVASASEILSGFSSLSPSRVITGIGTKIWAEYVKHLRSPNRAVTRLFDAAERQQSGAPPKDPIIPNIPISPILPDLQRSGADAMGLTMGEGGFKLAGDLLNFPPPKNMTPLHEALPYRGPLYRPDDFLGEPSTIERYLRDAEPANRA